MRLIHPHRLPKLPNTKLRRPTKFSYFLVLSYGMVRGIFRRSCRFGHWPGLIRVDAKNSGVRQHFPYILYTAREWCRACFGKVAAVTRSPQLKLKSFEVFPDASWHPIRYRYIKWNLLMQYLFPTTLMHWQMKLLCRWNKSFFIKSTFWTKNRKYCRSLNTITVIDSSAPGAHNDKAMRIFRKIEAFLPWSTLTWVKNI